MQFVQLISQTIQRVFFVSLRFRESLFDHEEVFEEYVCSMYPPREERGDVNSKSAVARLVYART